TCTCSHKADYPKGDSSFINNQRPSNFILEAPFILRIDKSGWKRSLALIIQGVVSQSHVQKKPLLNFLVV
ncbi:hypothetical protein Gogos_012426, partial [Gossypium gossypioides]|nr:hypothetical protein [Gossypium gossypioides]